MKTENHYEGFNKNELKSNIYTDLNGTLIDNVNYVECQKKNAEMCRQVKNTLDENVNVMREKQKILNISKDKRNKSKLDYANCEIRIKNCDMTYKEIMEKTKVLEEIYKEIERIENEIKELENTLSNLNNEEKELENEMSRLDDEEEDLEDDLPRLDNEIRNVQNSRTGWARRWGRLSWYGKLRNRKRMRRDVRNHRAWQRRRIAQIKTQKENIKKRIPELRAKRENIKKKIPGLKEEIEKINPEIGKWNNIKLDNKRLQANNLSTYQSLQSLYTQNNCKTTPNCFREQDNVKSAEHDFMSAEANYNTAKSIVNYMNTEYEFCKDPLKNLCKDRIKEFEMDHEHINKNMKKLNKEGYANLEENIELNNQLREMQNNNASRRIQEKKKLYTEPHIKTLKEKDPNSLLENEICKNVVLTTISSVLLYYFFFEI